MSSRMLIRLGANTLLSVLTAEAVLSKWNNAPIYSSRARKAKATTKTVKPPVHIHLGCVKRQGLAVCAVRLSLRRACCDGAVHTSREHIH